MLNIGNTEKLAVLVPVFNGGSNLLRSVASCANAGLSGKEYEIIVVDNCSTDGAVDSLPAVDAAGAAVRVFRNPANIGRVANWNRAVDLAIDLGFTCITFLFAGDCWGAGTALGRLIGSVRQFGARAGFAPFVVTNGEGLHKYESRRFYVTGDMTVCGSGEFLTTMLQSGIFPLGPLQANVYRVDATNRPLFDPAQPTRADVQATLDFIHQTDGPIVIASHPFLEWREHAGRFHASMGPARTIEDYMATFQIACTQTQLPVNYGRAKCWVVLNSCRLVWKDAPVSEWPRLLRVIANCSWRTPYRVNPLHFLEALWLRFVLGRRPLQFG